MNIKVILGAIIVVAIILIGISAMGNNSNKQVIEVGGLTYQIPSNYEVDNQSSYITVKSGDASIRIVNDSSKSSLNKTVTKYIKMKESDNYSIQAIKLRAEDTVIYKTNEVNNTKVLHYWFEINGNVYEMYTGSGNQNTDNLVIELVKSIKKD